MVAAPLGVASFGRQHEKRPPVFAAKHARNRLLLERNALDNLATFSPAHDLFARRRGNPDRTFAIQTNAVRQLVRSHLTPQALIDQNTVLCNVKCAEPASGAFRDHERTTISA